LQPLPPIEESLAVLEVVPSVGAYLKHKSEFTWAFDVLVGEDAVVGDISND
jgi:hypothetical protein